MQKNMTIEYAVPELLHLDRPSMIVSGQSNLNDPRDVRTENDEWIKYDDTDEEL